MVHNGGKRGAPVIPGGSYEVSPSELLKALDGAVEPIHRTPLYRFGALCVALAMILLPLLYVALVGLVAYGVYWHATANTHMLEMDEPPRSMIVLYIGPIIFGLSMVLFMTKPLLARRAAPVGLRTLDPGSEPLLFAFVENIAALVGAPVPTRIAVDCEVNAAASFRRGPLSALQRELVLTIGLPLVTALSIRELASIVAHELGHFAQGTGMRLAYTVWSVNHWFAGVVYERDEWDDRMDEWAARTGSMTVKVVLAMPRFGIWLSRKFLWMLMTIGHVIGAFFSRQMEFHADRYAISVAGSDAFEQMILHLPLLGIAEQRAQRASYDSWADGRLPDDLPALIAAVTTELPDKAHQHVRESVDAAVAGRFDTHPADSERIARAQARKDPGIFRLTHPASVLFTDLPTVSRAVTLSLYGTMRLDSAGGHVDLGQHNLISTAELLRRRGVAAASIEALRRVFMGNLLAHRPVFLPIDALELPTQLEEAIAGLRAARQRMTLRREKVAQALRSFDEAFTKMLMAHEANALLGAGLLINAGDFQLGDPTQDAARAAIEQARRAQEEVAGILDDFARDAGQRLALALQLAHAPEVREKIDGTAGDEDLDRCREAVAALAKLKRLAAPMQRLRVENHALSILVQNLEGREKDQDMVGETLEHARRTHRVVATLVAAGTDIRYPFAHARGAISLADYIAAELPNPDDVWSVSVIAENALVRVTQLYLRLVGSMASTVEQVEDALGLPREAA